VVFKLPVLGGVATGHSQGKAGRPARKLCGVLATLFASAPRNGLRPKPVSARGIGGSAARLNARTQKMPTLNGWAASIASESADHSALACALAEMDNSPFQGRCLNLSRKRKTLGAQPSCSSQDFFKSMGRMVRQQKNHPDRGQSEKAGR